MRIAYCAWGGVFGPILPADSPSQAERLASLFRVDALHTASADSEVRSWVDSLKHLPNPFHGELFYEDDTRVHARLLDIRHPLRRLADLKAQNRLVVGFRAQRIHWQPDDPIAPALAAMFGAFPEGNIGSYYEKLAEERIETERVEIPSGATVPGHLLWRAIPRLLSSFEVTSAPRGLRDHGLFVGRADSPADLIAFWNLTAAGQVLAFVDERFGKRLQPLVDDFVQALRESWRDRPRPHQEIAIWSLLDWPAGKTLPVALPTDAQRLFCSVEHTWNGFNVRPGFPTFDSHFTVASVETEYGRPVTYVPLAKKPYFEDFWATSQHAVVSIRATSHAPDIEAVTFCPPYVPQLNEYYGRQLHFQWDHARAEPDSVGIVTDVSESHVVLHGLDHDEVIARIFKAAGLEATPSNAGKICRRLILQMGGLQGCRLFKVRGVRDLVRDFPPPKTFSLKAALSRISSGWDETQELYVRGSRLTHRLAFDTLIERRVFRMGLDLECPSCRLSSWTSIDDVRSDRSCEYCGASHYVPPQLESRRWSYRASGLFARGDRQEGALPVALVLQQLDSNLSSDNAVYSSGMDLRWPDGGRNPCEVDFVYVEPVRGESPCMIVGEVKDRGGEIDENDVANLRAVAERVESIGVPCFSLFAKAGAFKAEEISRCREAQPVFKERVILLAERELGHHRITERIEDLPERLQYMGSVEELAQLTTHVCFGGEYRRPAGWSR